MSSPCRLAPENRCHLAMACDTPEAISLGASIGREEEAVSDAIARLEHWGVLHVDPMISCELPTHDGDRCADTSKIGSSPIDEGQGCEGGFL